MKKVKTVIKFDGPALSDKSMDVSELAPALIALSDVFKTANKMFNGDKSAVKVLVNADLEQNCFELVVQVAQTVWDQVELLISDENIKSVKEIAEWVGIIGGAGGTAFGTLFGLIKFLKGRTVKDTVVVKSESGSHAVQITVVGSNNTITVPEQVFQMYTNKDVRRKSVDVLRPLKSDGYEKLEFYENDKVYEEFTEEDVPDIFDEDLPDIRPSNEQISTIKTGVRIRKAAYEGRSKWTLIYLRAIEATIEDNKWLMDFQSNKISAPPNSSLFVDLEQRVIVNERGEALDDPIYRVLKVHRVELPQQQEDLFQSSDKDD